MDILEKAMQAFSKVHYTHLTLYYQASMTNDPNKAKSIVELPQLPSGFCSLLTAEFYLKNCQNQKSTIQTFAENWPWNNDYFNPFPFICILFALRSMWELPSAVHPPLLKSPSPSDPGCLGTARLSKGKLWANMESCVSHLEASYTEQMESAWHEET